MNNGINIAEFKGFNASKYNLISKPEGQREREIHIFIKLVLTSA